MTSWVIDASSVIDLLGSGASADATWGVVGSDPLHAPDLVTVEVMSALARQGRAGVPGVDAAAEAFATMPMTRHPSHRFLLPAWQRRHSLRVSDALYVEVARSLGLPLVTADARLSRTIVQQSLCEVVLVD